MKFFKVGFYIDFIKTNKDQLFTAILTYSNVNKIQRNC